MWIFIRRNAIFLLITVLLNLFTNIHNAPLTRVMAGQPKDSIYNQLINGENLIVHEERGVVFSRVGYYYEVDDIFGLTVTVPVSQYVCSILPIEQIEKLTLCVDYQEALRQKIDQEDIDSQSSIGDFLNFTNNTQFSAEKLPIKTHHHHHHRTKRFIPFVIAVATGVLGIIFTGGVAVYNTIKGAQLSNRVSEIQRSVSDTNKQLHSLEVSVLTNTNTTIQLARSFSKSQENMDVMRTNMETIAKHVVRLDTFAEAQTRYNLRTHAEHVYERMKSSMHRIENKDLNLDFVGMSEHNEILEIAYEHLKYSVPNTRESKATFVSRMLFAQTVQFFPSENGLHIDNATEYYPEHLGNIVFTSYFVVLKTNVNDKIQVYKLTALPFFIHKENGKEVFGLPKMIAISNNGYIEWREIVAQNVCDFGDYTVCRDPPVLQKRINNMCVEQLIATNRSFHCRVQDTPYSSPYFEKIGSDIMALSTSTPINCSITQGFHIFENLNIIHLGCNDSFYCEGNINFIGNKRCQAIKPYIIKTTNDDIIPVVESIYQLNMTLPKVYPFATDKNLVLTLEEQMIIQEKNIKETEKTGSKIFLLGNLSATRPLVIVLAVALSIFAILAVLITIYFIYRCRQNRNTSSSSIINIDTTKNQSVNPTAQSNQDNMGSLYDLLRAFNKNKENKY